MWLAVRKIRACNGENSIAADGSAAICARMLSGEKNLPEFHPEKQHADSRERGLGRDVDSQMDCGSCPPKNKRKPSANGIAPR
jgi:hypothetical protein